MYKSKQNEIEDAKSYAKSDSPKRKSKSRRKNSKSKGSRDPEVRALERQEAKHDYNNDPSYYFKDKVLMDQVASFSFNQFLGKSNVFQSYSFQKIKVPAVMRMYFNASPGWVNPNFPSDAGINIAARKLYAKLSSMNAKTTNYAPQDLVQLLLALQSILEATEWARRAFGLVFTYNKRNWAYPAELIRAMGINPDDFNTNLANYRLRFNAIVNSINQIAFPFDVPAFKKAVNMYSHIYLDSESPMAQTYLFLPATLWKFNEAYSEEGSGLDTIAWCHGVNNTSWVIDMFSNYLEKLKGMIQAILDSTTFNFIYADVLRVVDPKDLLTIPFISEDYIVMPEYDPMMLLQIDNATIVGTASAAASSESVTKLNDVLADVENNSIKYQPSFSGKPHLAVMHSRTILNFPHTMGNPDVDQKVEATRMISLDGDPFGELGASGWFALADHYLVDVGYNSSAGDISINTSCYPASAFSLEYLFKIVSALSRFNHAPRLYIYSSSGAPTSDTQVMEVIGDLDFFTDVDAIYLKGVNDLAYVNLYTPALADY